MNKTSLSLSIALLAFLLSTQTAIAADIEPFINKQVSNEIIKGISISPDGRYMAVASEDNYIHFLDKNGVKIWNSKILEGTLREVATNGDDVVVGIGYVESVDSKQRERGRVRLYSSAKDILFDKVLEPSDANSSTTVQHVAISSDGSVIAASDKNDVYILDKAGNILRKIPVNGLVTDVAISPNKEFGAASFGDTIYIFDSDGRVFQNFRIANNLIKGISISDDGHIAVLTQQSVLLYKNNRELWGKNANTGNFFTSISISPTGNQITVTSTKDGLFLFDINGAVVLRYPIDFRYASTDGRVVAAVKNTFLYLFNTTSYTTGSISVISTQGAGVYLDEKFAGTVPITISEVPIGAHAIRITKQGYESWVQNIDISYGDKKEISIMLVPSIPTTTPTPSPTPTPTPAPTPIPTPTPDVVVITKNALFFMILGVILITIPGVVYLRKRNSKLSPPASAQQIKIDTKNEPFIGGNCPYCGDLIKANSRITICPDCETPHHQECWEKHGGCTTFGCKRTP